MNIGEKMSSFLEGVLSNVKIFNPASLNDEIAVKTEWSPIKNGGANFKTKKLVKVSPNRFVYKPTLMMVLFPILFISIFLFVVVFMSIEFSDKFGPMVYAIGGGSLILPIIIAAYMFTRGRKQCVIDKGINQFYIGQSPSRREMGADNEQFCRLSDVYAIQIIEHYIRKTSSSSDSGSSYYNYELNFVLNDARRVNVTASSSSSQVVADAAILADFLQIPVWNALSSR